MLVASFPLLQDENEIEKRNETYTWPIVTEAGTAVHGAGEDRRDEPRAITTIRDVIE